MAGQTHRTENSLTVKVDELGSIPRLVSGVLAEKNEISILVSDTGREKFATQDFKALAITTTATRLDRLTTSKLDVVARRGIHLYANSTNTADVVIGGSAIVAHAAAASINGMPLSPGASIFIEVTRLSSIWADTITNTQYLHWLAY